MIPAANLRSFRYSLRTLFVLITVFACWLGYELNWIRQRHAVLITGNWRAYETVHDPFEDTHGQTVRAPGLLWFFGEPGYASLMKLRAGPVANKEKAELDRVKVLFPEAHIALFSL
jgi:hypothetical protein